MKRENFLVIISGKEFLTDKEGKKKLDNYQKVLNNKFRLNNKIKNELLGALRDVLIENQKNPSQMITYTAMNDAISIVGTSYENESTLKPISDRVSATIYMFKKFFKKHILIESFRKKLYFFLAFIFLIPAALLTNSLSYFDPPTQDSTPASVIQTTLGTVKLADYLENTRISDSSYPSYDSVTYSMILSLVLLSLFFVFVGKRSKKAIIIFGLFLFSIVFSFSMTDRYNRSMQYSLTPYPTADTNYTVERAVDDFDILYDCGSSINYIMPYTIDNIFYKLHDAGFALKEELQTASLYEEPSRQQICESYDKLRKTYSNEQIVLMTFMIDNEGNVRPMDYEEQDQQVVNGTILQNKLRTGFFVKD